MHRRGIVLVVGFLVAIVVAGGEGVSAPRLPGPATKAGIARAAVPSGGTALRRARMRME
jgi:hypothetical protein